jgi:hypothetical protein
MVGSAWAAGCWTLAVLLQRHGDREGETAPAREGQAPDDPA